MAPRSIPLFCQFLFVALFTLLRCSGGSAWVYTMGTLIDDVDSLPVFASSTHVLPGDLWDHSYGIDIPALSLGTCQTDRVTPYSCITSLSAFARPLQFSFDDQFEGHPTPSPNNHNSGKRSCEKPESHFGFDSGCKRFRDSRGPGYVGVEVPGYSVQSNSPVAGNSRLGHCDVNSLHDLQPRRLHGSQIFQDPLYCTPSPQPCPSFPSPPPVRW